LWSSGWSPSSAVLRNSGEVSKWIQRAERIREIGIGTMWSRVSLRSSRRLYRSRRRRHHHRDGGSGRDALASGALSWARILTLGLPVGTDRIRTMSWRSKASDGGQERRPGCGLVVGVSTPRKRGRRRCSSPRWVPPGGQIPNRYPGLGSSGLMWWKGLLGCGLVSFLFFFYLGFFSITSDFWLWF
jgi:hypothetical protein